MHARTRTHATVIREHPPAPLLKSPGAALGFPIPAAARDTLREPLPIKCVEATFVALLATCGWQGLDRVGLGFKSRGADCQVRRR